MQQTGFTYESKDYRHSCITLNTDAAASEGKSWTCFLVPPFFLLSAAPAVKGSVPEPSHPE